MAIQLISGKLDNKRITAYFKHAHKKRPLMLECLEDDTFLIADGHCIMKIPVNTDIYTLLHVQVPEPGKRVKYDVDSTNGVECYVNLSENWQRFCRHEAIYSLTVTHDLRECPGERGKSGTFYRKFTRKGQENTEFRMWIDKSMLDMLSPDLDELDGFIFELVDAPNARPGMLKVFARQGIVGYIMPGVNIEQH